MADHWKPNSFIARVKMSRQNILLVEGKDDKSFFERLCDQTYNVKIHTAQQISITTPTGNREKVERIANLISGEAYSNRFVGFVDREFREFELSTLIYDRLQRHNQIDRIVWSRGHSIENYLFEFSLIRDVLKDSMTIDPELTNQALSLMEMCFDDILRIACALGLCARDMKLLTDIYRSIEWSDFSYFDYSVSLDIDKYATKLVTRKIINEDDTAKFTHRFRERLKTTQMSRPEDVRWSCHGHTGMKMIWNAYAKLIDVVSKSNGSKSRARDALRIAEGALFKLCARIWTERDRRGAFMESPRICFDVLGNST